MSPAASASISLLCLLQLTASSELQSEDVADESQLESNERHPNLVTVSLILGVLVTLSERPDTVSRALSRGAKLAARGWCSEWGGGLALDKGKLCL